MTIDATAGPTKVAAALLLGLAAWGCTGATEGGAATGGPGGGAGADTARAPVDSVEAADSAGLDLPGRPPGPAAPAPGTAWVISGADTVVAEVAATAEARTRGLQGREDVPPGTGMLFVYPERDVRSFWMVNTPVSLDIAFLDVVEGEEAGWSPGAAGDEVRLRVVDVQSMQAETSTLHTSAAPAVMALEVTQGWLGEHGVEAGDVVVVVWGGGEPDGGG